MTSRTDTSLLIENLHHHPSVAVRMYAAHALGHDGSWRAVQALVDALQDPESDVRRQVAHALRHARWQPANTYEAAQFYIALLDWESCVALGADAVNRLIAMLNDRQASVRWNAVRALGLIGDHRAITPLITLTHDDRELLVQRRAIEALHRMGTPRALQAIDDWYRFEW